MAKKPTLHYYADELSFQRLMLLIATLIQFPGIGCPQKRQGKNSHHDAKVAIREKMLLLAPSYKITLPRDSPSLATIASDLKALRKYGLLDKRMYRWGYYLGTGALNSQELSIAFNALASQAQHLGDPQIITCYENLQKRLRGLKLDSGEDFFYPVRAYLNRPIMYTDPQQMMAKGHFRHTLYNCLDTIETAITVGEKIKIRRNKTPYKHQKKGIKEVYPLQLVYHDIAWYLLLEEESSFHSHQAIQHLAIVRLDRFEDYCEILDEPPRGTEKQRKSLKVAEKLWETGWGIFLGNPQQQYLERNGKLDLIEFKIRFFDEAVTFIQEGECRHPRQKFTLSKKKLDGKYSYIDYCVKLPPRSLDEFSRWVLKHGSNAQAFAPKELVRQHRDEALKLLQRYELSAQA